MPVNSPRVEVRLPDSRNDRGDEGQDTELGDASEPSYQSDHGKHYFDEERDPSDMSETGGDVYSDTLHHSERETIYDSDHGTEDVHSDYGSEYSSSAESLVDAETLHGAESTGEPVGKSEGGGSEGAHFHDKQHQPSGIIHNQQVLYAPNQVREAPPANQTPSLVINIHQERNVHQHAAASLTQSHNRKDISNQNQRLEDDDTRHQQVTGVHPTNVTCPQLNDQHELEQVFPRQPHGVQDVSLQKMQGTIEFPMAAVPSSEPITTTGFDCPESNFYEESEYSVDRHNEAREMKAYEEENHRSEIAMRQAELESKRRELEEQRLAQMNADMDTGVTKQRYAQEQQQAQRPTKPLEGLESNAEFAQSQEFLSRLKERQRLDELAAEEEALQLDAQHRQTQEALMLARAQSIRDEEELEAARSEMEERQRQRAAANARQLAFDTAQLRQEYQEEDISQQVPRTRLIGQQYHDQRELAQDAQERNILAAQQQAEFEALQALKLQEEEQRMADEQAQRDDELAARRANEQARQMQEESRWEANRQREERRQQELLEKNERKAVERQQRDQQRDNEREINRQRKEERDARKNEERERDQAARREKEERDAEFQAAKMQDDMELKEKRAALKADKQEKEHGVMKEIRARDIELRAAKESDWIDHRAEESAQRHALESKRHEFRKEEKVTKMSMEAERFQNRADVRSQELAHRKELTTLELETRSQEKEAKRAMELQEVQANADLRLQETVHRQEKGGIIQKALEDKANSGDMHEPEDDKLPKMPLRQPHPADKRAHNDLTHHGPNIGHGNAQPEGHQGLPAGSFPQGGCVDYFHPVGYPGYGPQGGYPNQGSYGGLPSSDIQKKNKGNKSKSKIGANKAEEKPNGDTIVKEPKLPVAISGGSHTNKQEDLHEAVSKSEKGTKSTTTVSKIKVPGASVYIKRTKVSDSSKTKDSSRYRTRSVNESSQSKSSYSQDSNQLSVETEDLRKRDQDEVKYKKKREVKHEGHSEVEQKKKREVKFEEQSEIKYKTKQNASSSVKVSHSRSTTSVDATNHYKPPSSDYPQDSVAVGNPGPHSTAAFNKETNKSHSSPSDTKSSQSHKTIAKDERHPKPQDAANIDGPPAGRTRESNVQASQHVKTVTEQSSKSNSSSSLSKKIGVKRPDRPTQQFPSDLNPNASVAARPADTDNRSRHTESEAVQHSPSGKMESTNTHLPNGVSSKATQISTRKPEADIPHLSHSNLKIEHMRSTSITTTTEYLHSSSSSSTRGVNPVHPNSSDTSTIAAQSSGGASQTDTLHTTSSHRTSTKHSQSASHHTSSEHSPSSSSHAKVETQNLLSPSSHAKAETNHSPSLAGHTKADTQHLSSPTKDTQHSSSSHVPKQPDTRGSIGSPSHAHNISHRGSSTSHNGPEIDSVRSTNGKGRSGVIKTGHATGNDTTLWNSGRFGTPKTAGTHQGPLQTSCQSTLQAPFQGPHQMPHHAPPQTPIQASQGIPRQTHGQPVLRVADEANARGVRRRPASPHQTYNEPMMSVADKAHLQGIKAQPFQSSKDNPRNHKSVAGNDAKHAVPRTNINNQGAKKTESFDYANAYKSPTHSVNQHTTGDPMSRTQSAGRKLQEVVLTNNPYATRVTEEETGRGAEDKLKKKAANSNNAAEDKGKGNRTGSLFKTGANKKPTEAENPQSKAGKPEETDKQKPIEQQVAGEDKGKQGMMGSFFGTRADKNTVKAERREPSATTVEGKVEKKLVEQPDNAAERSKRGRMAGLFQTASDKKPVGPDQPQPEATKKQGEHQAHPLAPQAPAVENIKQVVTGKPTAYPEHLSPKASDPKVPQAPRTQPKHTILKASGKSPAFKQQSSSGEQSSQGIMGKLPAKPESLFQKTPDSKVGNAEKVRQKADNVEGENGNYAKDKKENGLFGFRTKRTAQPVATDTKAGGERKIQPPFEEVRSRQNTNVAHEAARGNHQEAIPRKQQEQTHEGHSSGPNVNSHPLILNQQERTHEKHLAVPNANLRLEIPKRQQVVSRTHTAANNVNRLPQIPSQQQSTSTRLSVATNANQHQGSPRLPGEDSRRIPTKDTPKVQGVERKAVKEPVQGKQHQIPPSAHPSPISLKEAEKARLKNVATQRKLQEKADHDAQAAEKKRKDIADRLKTHVNTKDKNMQPNLPKLSDRRQRKEKPGYSDNQKRKKELSESQDAEKKRLKDLSDHAKLVEKAKQAEAEAEHKRQQGIKDQHEACEKAERDKVAAEKKRVEEQQKAVRERVERDRKEAEKREKERLKRVEKEKKEKLKKLEKEEKAKKAAAAKQPKGVVPVKKTGKKVVVMPKTSLKAPTGVGKKK
ncbi:hypothetical protein PTNB85_01770 [Pyrenophora teres f. teres]|nr:hypothetical protein PTNB85_01770 [Pyrenophora teres f. teres]KAE8867853.1 hypothetical protein PTNB29_01764 [Pyrenophora teres f. teres]